MKVDTKECNLAFQSIMQNSNQKIFLDANFFIPPDRSKTTKVRPYSFEDFKQNWLIPLLSEFTELSMYEAVYDELVEEHVKVYADEQSKAIPSRLKVHYDSELNSEEKAMMNYYISKIAVHSLYDPYKDNAKDRGEVKSLSYMAVKKYPFFAANDALPIRLIKESDRLNTGLDDMQIIQMYELIYYLYTTGKYNNKELRILYKYQYYLTPGDKRNNPEWGIFIEQMDKLYNGKIKNT